VGYLSQGKGSFVIKSDDTDAPMLQFIAQEEGRLLAKIAGARSEAQRIVDEATAEARAILEESQAAIAREIAEMRRAGERQAAQEHAAIQESAEAALAEAQAQAQIHAKQVAQDVLHRILPGGSKKAP
jgi:vacuolar-type H+-ATPase subunit H